MKESTSQQQVQLSPEEKLAYLRSHPRKIKSGMVRPKSVGSVIADIIIVLLVGALALVAIIPMWHVLMSSFSDGRSIFYYSGIAFFPEGGFTFRAYEELFSFEDGLIWTGYMNTILYVIGTLAVGLVLNVLAGYCLSRKTKLSGLMSALCVFTVIFSAGQGPTFYVVDMLGLTQTRFAVILTECTMGMYMIIGAMAFRSVPEETVESAKLEGAGHLRIMFEIMLPQCFSLFMVTVLFTFVAAWNSFIGARLYNAGITDLDPLQLLLPRIKESSDRVASQIGNANWARYPMQFAGVIAATLPIMVIMPFFQKQLESGALGGAVKG